MHNQWLMPAYHLLLCFKTEIINKDMIDWVNNENTFHFCVHIFKSISKTESVQNCNTHLPCAPESPCTQTGSGGYQTACQGFVYHFQTYSQFPSIYNHSQHTQSRKHTPEWIHNGQFSGWLARGWKQISDRAFAPAGNVSGGPGLRCRIYLRLTIP